LEALPVFLSLAKDKDAKALRKLALRLCFNALILFISFLVFSPGVLATVLGMTMLKTYRVAIP